MSLDDKFRAAKMPRTIHEYEIPPSLRWDGGPSTVGLRALTVAEELTASKVGGLDYMKAQYEATRMSIASIDGRPVAVKDGEDVALWERGGPKLRSLLVQAYNRLSSPSADEADGFFASATVKVE